MLKRRYLLCLSFARFIFYFTLKFDVIRYNWLVFELNRERKKVNSGWMYRKEKVSEKSVLENIEWTRPHWISMNPYYDFNQTCAFGVIWTNHNDRFSIFATIWFVSNNRKGANQLNSILLNWFLSWYLSEIQLKKWNFQIWLISSYHVKRKNKETIANKQKLV